MAPRIYIAGALASLALAAVVAASASQAQDLEFTPEQQTDDQEYLRVLPRADGTHAARAKTENVPYRRCDKDPFVASKAYRASSADAYASRMIYDYVRSRRVLNLRDCTCHGKVAPFSEVTAIIADIEAEHGSGWNRHNVAREYGKLGLQLFTQAEAMCGGDF
ncbi:hypothetical protein [Paracoccus laeviglucosivorans]|uniref:Uncharacterized protein n=1 Tax=Paracoccus laeviglucosivorans TaxID=1197861 RepID=A0A521FUG3_9RHOB|nr:hypothetical protein [Paracoccus laeviglucosivorans]SMO99181.1 hypothetical protein SAMN06265221_1418 [Paracoccus laeviglucosivorans]